MLSGHTAAPVPRGQGSGDAQLAEGLMLVRASTLKMLRLQLAMERRDRRSAIEAVDELLALDRSLSECLATAPVAELDEERAALNREKLTLAAQVITRDPWVEPLAQLPSPEPADPESDPWLTEAWEDELVVPGVRRRARWWLIGLLLVVAAIAIAGFVLGVPPEIARIAPHLGGFL